MAIEMMPVPSNTDRGKNAAERALADDAWAAQVAEETEQATAAKETATLDAERIAAEAAAEAQRQGTQNEGLKEMQAEIDRLDAELLTMKKERANWDWNNVPALVSALGKMAKTDPGLIGEFEDASKALKLMTDLARVKKQFEFVQTAQAASPTEVKH
ncbi:MAG: hypothetical protein ACEQSB_02275 [Undibacterium sp.]